MMSIRIISSGSIDGRQCWNSRARAQRGPTPSRDRGYLANQMIVRNSLFKTESKKTAAVGRGSAPIIARLHSESHCDSDGMTVRGSHQRLCNKIGTFATSTDVR